MHCCCPAEAPSEWQQVIINLPAELLISHAKTQRAASATLAPGGNEELCQHPLYYLACRYIYIDISTLPRSAAVLAS